MGGGAGECDKVGEPRRTQVAEVAGQAGSIRNTSKKPFVLDLLYRLRDLRSRPLFRALKRYCRGRVLDVGGWDFCCTAIARGVPFDSWIVVEPQGQQAPLCEDRRLSFVVGDGCRLNFADGSADTVLSIQVLEHVIEPITMTAELARVLKPGGHLILLVPQTSTIHMAPQHYYNFTRFWIERVLHDVHCDIIELKPLGGVWSSIASRLFYFLLQSVRYPGMSAPECKRNVLFFVLYPVMILLTLILIPLCMILSLGDLTEEPNNHLVVARKRGSDGQPG
jgi:SAM-dependent methyltransferase